MRLQEIDCFSETLNCDAERISVFDLIQGNVLSLAHLEQFDVVLLGGSGDYSVADGGPWWNAAADAMHQLVESAKPTFASCWGFQALARALGGGVVTDLQRAELGTLTLDVTPAGQDDPVFSSAGPTLDVQMGHQDIVEELPAGAICLASSGKVRNEALRFVGKPIYGTQFHPELNRNRLVERLTAYPQYVEKIAGVPLDEFVASCRDTPRSASLLQRFIEVHFG